MKVAEPSSEKKKKSADFGFQFECLKLYGDCDIAPCVSRTVSLGVSPSKISVRGFHQV